MKIKITPSMARKYPYEHTCGCPLYHALKTAGVDVGAVYLQDVLVGSRLFRFPWKDWNFNIYKALVKRKRSLWLDIPGLEEAGA